MKLLSLYRVGVTGRKNDSTDNLRNTSGNRSGKHGGCGNDRKPSENGVELEPRAGKGIESRS